MGRAFVYVVLGGGVAAGYAALEFARRGGYSRGELCIISEEAVAPYERPALSKGYLLPEGPSRLPKFHTCVGANDELLTTKWYKEQGIELVLGTRVISADVRRKTLLTATGETISYKTLIIATGARALKLEEFGINGSDAANICYLRNLEDADKLVNAMNSCSGGNAVVIGGGYIGMECAAALVTNKIKVTMVFPEKHCMGRLFTEKIAEYYENYYTSKGVTFTKGTVLTSFEKDSTGKVAPYERPALSKGYLLPRGAARLPGFHTCVGANDELLTEQWYKDHGIELVLATRVISADVQQKALLTNTGETISYKTLIVATGARALKLEEFGVTGSDAANVCYLRSLEDADKMVGVMRSCHGGNAVVIGGGYIGMECAAALVANEIKVTMVFPGKRCMDRFFTPKIAEFYENYYAAKGVTFIKGARVTSLEASDGRVAAAILRDGRRLPADMVVVGVGARANAGLFDGQLAMEKGGIRVNGRMQTSDYAVYAVGDVAAFPVALLGGQVRRFEHVDCARRTARRAVAAILEPADGPAEQGKKGYDYLPFFYSRVFGLSWQFYGDNVGEAVHFGDFSPGSGHATAKFVVLWVSGGRVSGAFIEGGSREENEGTAGAVRRGASVAEVAAELLSRGLAFADQESRRKGLCSNGHAAGCDKATYAWHATVGLAAAVSIAAFAYWYGWQAPYVVKREF